jgi:hypothetical protein
MVVVAILLYRSHPLLAMVVVAILLYRPHPLLAVRLLQRLRLHLAAP